MAPKGRAAKSAAGRVQQGGGAAVAGRPAAGRCGRGGSPAASEPAPGEQLNGDGALRALRDVAGLAPEIVQLSRDCELGPRSMHTLSQPAVRDLLQVTPAMEAAWSAAWESPSLRVALFQVLSSCTRHLQQLVALEDDSASFVACHRCFAGMCKALSGMLRGTMSPTTVSTATRVRVVKLALGTQLLPALHALMAAAAEAGAKLARGCLAAAATRAAGSPNRPSSPNVERLLNRSQQDTPGSAVLDSCSMCIQAFSAGAVVGADARLPNKQGEIAK